MKTVKASEFKEKCLYLMDLVNESGIEIIITKNGVSDTNDLEFLAPGKPSEAGN